MNQKDLHEKILYPVTRVKAGKAGGSGVLVYSEPDSKEEGKYINIILTCQHVIDGAISVKDEWDSLLKREIKNVIYSLKGDPNGNTKHHSSLRHWISDRIDSAILPYRKT